MSRLQKSHFRHAVMHEMMNQDHWLCAEAHDPERLGDQLTILSRAGFDFPRGCLWNTRRREKASNGVEDHREERTGEGAEKPVHEATSVVDHHFSVSFMAAPM
jgi:hypothetical protein